VRVHSAGLCGSDAHAYKCQGYEWIPIPRVMSHEYAGRVVEVGEHVSNVAVDDTVVERPIHECGHCFQCLNGQSNVCENFEITGMHTDGAYTEYVTVDERNLVTIPEEVPLEHPAATEPTSIAARAVLDQSVVQPGDRVLVEGPGPIGMLSAVIAHSLGANVVLSGLDRDAEHRLPLGAELGLETVNAQRDDLDEVADAFTDGVGFDVVFDTTGHHPGVEMVAEQIRRGGQIVVVGLPADDSELFVTPLVRGEVDLNTSDGSAHRNFSRRSNSWPTTASTPERSSTPPFRSTIPRRRSRRSSRERRSNPSSASGAPEPAVTERPIRVGSSPIRPRPRFDPDHRPASSPIRNRPRPGLVGGDTSFS
jgi:L-iditol 2-dehydrogenase